MDDMTMLFSGYVVKDNRKIVRVSFRRGEHFAEGILPDAVIENSQGFTVEEIRKLESFLLNYREDIMRQAKEINPIRSWLKE